MVHVNMGLMIACNISPCRYGEKIVKGSPNPRSYYKCSHQGCLAKKIVERTEYGEIINTEYKVSFVSWRLASRPSPCASA